MMREFVPKTVVCLKEGYGWRAFFHDLGAGLSVGIIALPLALAFAIASGVTPEKGLYTAIIAGFLISLLGGSRLQIGGPTGAFVVIIYGVVQQFGYEGLAVATLIAAVLMILMGLFRFGVLLKFIPFPVTTGFTTGIAVIIFSSQIKDFFGLETPTLPPGFIDKWQLYFSCCHTINLAAFAIAITTLFLIVLIRKIQPRLPAVMIALTITTIISYLFELPVVTIDSKFGSIPRTLSAPTFPHISFDLIRSVFPSAITIALLGGIESLLSALVADGMTGHKHRSNCELIAQGIANMGSIIFGGIPATGAIARTTANIKLGAKTPISGMIHAVTVLLFMIFFAPFVSKVPLAALSAVLVFVAWNMSELPHFFEIAKGQLGDAIVLILTFLLTIVIDLTVAVQVGVILAAVIFLKRMTDKTSIEVTHILAQENEYEKPVERNGIIFTQEIPKEIAIFEIKGPFFYSVANLLDEALDQMNPKPKVFILCVNNTPLIDATGINAIKLFAKKCKQKQILFLIGGITEEMLILFKKAKIERSSHLFPTVASALAFAKNEKDLLR